jgi:hypothetical protein
VTPTDPQDVELFKATIEAGRGALRSGFLTNGAGSISILTLIGNLAKDSQSHQAVASLALPLGCFTLGVSLCSGAAGLTYLGQSKFQFFRDEGNTKAGHRINKLTMWMVLSSYALFLLGCAFAYRTFANGL